MASRVIDIRFTRIEKDQENRLTRQFVSWFSENRLEPIQRYRKWQDRSAQLVGRLLLLAALKDRGLTPAAPLPIDYTPQGRPFLVSSPLDFNISHSGSLVVCALAHTTRIGIDMEFMKDLDLADFEESFTGEEWSCIKGSPDPLKTFYQYWTMKECVLKADGRGLNLPLSEVRPQNNRVILEGREWFVQEIRLVKGYACHLAVDRAGFEPVIRETAF